MLFEIERTSIWGDEKPCDEAFKIELTDVETRTLKTPEEFDIKFSKQEGKWLSVGSNHRYDSSGYITRDRGMRNSWGIKINSLKDIINLQNKYGDLIIKTSYIDKITPSIEIYDDYRE